MCCSMMAFFIWFILFLLMLAICVGFVQQLSFFKYLRSKKSILQRLYIPHLEKLQHTTASPKDTVFYINRIISVIIWLSAWLSIVSMTFLCASLITTENPLERISNYLTGVSPRFRPKSLSASIFLIDCSGSMSQPYVSSSPHTSRLDTVKRALLQSIQAVDESTGLITLIGIDAFARVSETKVPLTYDRKYIFSQIEQLQAITNDHLNGTACGYALMKAVLKIVSSGILQQKKQNTDVFQPPVTKCIIVSDGIEEPHPEDKIEPYRSMRLIQSLTFAQQNHIIVDYVLIGPSWNDMHPDERSRLTAAVEATGGHLRHIEFGSALSSTLENMLLENSEKDSYRIPYTSHNLLWALYIALFGVMAIMFGRGILLMYEKYTKREASSWGIEPKRGR